MITDALRHKRSLKICIRHTLQLNEMSSPSAVQSEFSVN